MKKGADFMIVYICCAGGLTSSLFCSNIQDAEEDNKIFVDDIKTVFTLYKKGQLGRCDYVLTYGPAENINKAFIDEYNFEDFIDLILISPQARFLLKSITNLVSPLNIPCDVIDMRTFGTMNGKEGLKLIQKYENIKSKNLRVGDMV